MTSNDNEISGIGERLRKTRKEQGFTQAKLGEVTHTNQAVIQKIENGSSNRPRCIMELAQVLEVNPAWLQFGPKYASKERPAP